MHDLASDLLDAGPGELRDLRLELVLVWALHQEAEELAAE